MDAEQLKHSAIFLALKKDKKVQNAVVVLGKTDEWKVLMLFTAELKQVLLESILEVNSLAEIQKVKHLIRGFESIVLLPRLVDLVKDVAKEDLKKKKTDEEEAKRRKYSPGAFARSVISKFKS